MKILLVEDYASIRTYLSEMLQRAGHVVEAVESLEAAKDAVIQPDVVVSDFYLDTPDRFETAFDVQRLWPLTPMVVISGARREDAAFSFEGEWLLKPVLIDELLGAITRATGKPA